MTDDPIRLTARVERKQLDLPRFAVVPAGLLQPWRLEGTTMVEVRINGTPVSRRTIKRWDDERCFVSITAQDCRAAGIDTGDHIELTLSRAATDLPVELSDLIAANARAAAAWRSLSEARKRDLREFIGSARQAATRTRRARKWLLGSA